MESFQAKAAQQGIALSASIAPQVGMVTMDTARIGRVLNNLISNALRHTKSGGQVQLITEREAGLGRIKVMDSGEGIAPEDLSYVVDQFYRGEKSRCRQTEGAGLGLAIDRGIIQAHGGEISVESQLGSGSTFCFTLSDKKASAGAYCIEKTSAEW